MNFKIDIVVIMEGFHRMDGSRWVKCLLRHCKLFTSLGCKPMTFVLAINLDCHLFILMDSLFSMRAKFWLYRIN